MKDAVSIGMESETKQLSGSESAMIRILPSPRLVISIGKIGWRWLLTSCSNKSPYYNETYSGPEKVLYDSRRCSLCHRNWGAPMPEMDSVRLRSACSTLPWWFKCKNGDLHTRKPFFASLTEDALSQSYGKVSTILSKYPSLLITELY